MLTKVPETSGVVERLRRMGIGRKDREVGIRKGLVWADQAIES